MWKHSAVPCCIKRSGGLHEEEKKEEKNTENRVPERSGLGIYKSEKGRPVFTWIFQIAVALALAAVVAIFFFQSITMQESSMEPTLETGERFL